ncbi:MAG: twin-arginine translocation signal domain-containing protein [Caldilineaceae bacterium]
MSEISRRGFLVGCSAAIAAMAGGRLGYVAFGSPLQEPTQEILIVVFLRGGMDGLSAVMPIAGNDRGYYENNRADIAVPTTGNNAALRLTDFFGLHPAGAPLHGLYQDKKLAIVHATGLISDTRSHFDAMKYMELGTPGSKSATNGWLTRHLQTSPATGNNAIMPALSVGNLSPTSLAGSTEAIGMSSASGFEFGGNSRYNTNQRQMVRKMYDGASWLHEAGLQTLDAVDVVEFGNPGNYTPENGANYPNNSFGRNLQTVAQMIKLQLGLKVATVDLGGWDTA